MNQIDSYSNPEETEIATQYQVNWWFLCFTDENVQRKYRSYRIHLNHNQFLFSAFLAWYTFNVMLHFYFIFDASVEFGARPAWVLMILNTSTFNILSSTLIIIYENKPWLSNTFKSI